MKKWKAVLIVAAAVISVSARAYRIVGYVLYRNIVSDKYTAEYHRADGFEETEEPVDEKFQRIEKEMQAIADYLYTEGALADAAGSDETDWTLTMELDAKGWPYAVVYREEMDLDGGKGYKEQTITYDYTREYERQDEFVYEEDYYDENGNSVKDTQILDFFLVDRDTMEVIDEHTTEWD